jgi:uncharacterized protein involved in outer membrane biogenesis
MKRGLKISGIVLLSLLLVIIAAALIIPVAFKEKIKERVEAGLNDRLTAKVSFGDYRLSLLRAFPNASFSMNDLSVTGTGEFGGDTLAAVKSLGITINLKSLFGDKGYEIKSVVIDRPFVNAIVNSDGQANWDIMKEQEKPDGEAPQPESDGQAEAPGLKMSLRRFTVNEGRLRYTDRESDLSASVEDLDFNLSGNMAGSQSVLDLEMTAGDADLVMDKIPWLTDATIGFRAGLDAMLDSMKFTLRENVLKVNDISLKFSGTAAMPGDDIDLDMVFSSPETSFKSLLSLVPAF